MFSGKSNWLGMRCDPAKQATVLYFRRRFTAKSTDELTVRVSADSRYKLFLNGKLISLGPCKSDSHVTYYETLSLTGLLREGENLLAAMVVHFSGEANLPGAASIGPCALSRTGAAAFMLDGVLLRGGELLEDLSSDASWSMKEERGILFGQEVYAGFMRHGEDVDFKTLLPDWKTLSNDDSGWQPAPLLTETLIDRKSAGDYGELKPWVLEPRPIPPLYRRPQRFRRVVKQGGGLPAVDSLDNLTIPSNSSGFYDLDMGELTTAYLQFYLQGGAGSKIRVIYAECYEQPDGTGDFKKGRRDDSTGTLRGERDLFLPDGRCWEYETFWFRTFRFVRLEIQTGTEPLTIEKIHCLKTAYPLTEESSYRLSGETDAPLWEISVRTLSLCMHETYEDCPYYEQLQYIMDSRLQMLFTYQLTPDDRLARKCIHDFHSSLLPNGLLQSRYPSVWPQIIPGFSLQWIFMLTDHLRYFGDFSFVKRYLPTVDAVLGWFERQLTESGLVEQTGYWMFVDWVHSWKQNSIPPAAFSGPMTVYTLLYAYALRQGAWLNARSGRGDTAREYEERAEAVCEAVRRHCFDEERQLFTDGPQSPTYSQHAQLWAVLAGAASDPTALLQKALTEELPQVSYAMAFYLFRALEENGMYAHTDQLFNLWREMMGRNLTTWVEDPVRERSDCHGWGALPLYEFPAMILGIQPMEPGFSAVRINPHPLGRTSAEGQMQTVRGEIGVKWSVEEGVFRMTVTAPAGMKKTVLLPNGERHDFSEERREFSCPYSDSL